MLHIIEGEYPTPKRATYLDTASVGLTPRSAVEHVRRMVELIYEDPSHVGDAHKYAMRVKEAFAELVGARPDDVAVVGGGTLEGIWKALQAIGCGGGSVVTTDLEYAGLLALLEYWTAHCGLELRIARHVGGRVPLDEFRRLIDEKTHAVVVSSVQWVNGHRLDVRALGEMTQRSGAYLVVDGIQEAGAIRPELRHVDFYVAGTHKWLISPFGLALAYVGKRVAELVGPTGMNNVDVPMKLHKYLAFPHKGPRNLMASLPRGARRFDPPGMWPVLALAGASASLEVLRRLGIGRVEGHVRRLASLLVEGLMDVGGITVLGGSGESGIVTFTAGNDERLVRRLAEGGIAVSLRGMSGLQGVRASTHIYNDEGSVERLLEAVRGALRG